MINLEKQICNNFESFHPLKKTLNFIFESAVNVFRNYQITTNVKPILMHKIKETTHWADISDILTYCRYQFNNKQREQYQDFRFFVCDEYVLMDMKGNLFSELRGFVKESLAKNVPLFVPLLIDQHWHLIVVDPHTRNIEHYDSLGEKISASTQKCIDQISDMVMICNKIKYPVLTQTEVHQQNNYDCGVFVAYYMEQRLKGRKFSEITASDPGKLLTTISYYRQSMYARIGRVFTGKEVLTGKEIAVHNSHILALRPPRFLLQSAL